MSSLEGYKPLLKRGRLLPSGDHLIYETEGSKCQILLPNEAASFLVYFNGEHTLSDIVELVYKSQGHVRFRTLLKTIHFLNERGFLENSSELLKLQEKKHEPHTLNLNSLFNFAINNKVAFKRSYPNVFYVLSMLTIIFSIYASSHFIDQFLEFDFIRINDSYAYGFLISFTIASVLLTLKNVFKTLLLLLLTGRAYNFGISMKGYALNYEVSSDSLFLIQNRLFLSLYQLASLTSIVAISALPIMLIDSLPFKTAILQISSILFFIELNPYGKTELNAFLKSLYPDEIMGRVSEFLRSKSVLSLVHPASTKHFHYAVYMAFYFNLVWCSVATYASANAIWQNYNFITSDMTANKISMLFGILSLGIIFTFGFIAGYNFISIFTVRIITAFVFIKKFLHKHSTSIKVDHYNHNEILGVLDDLPLFSYFPRELLNMIVQKSTVMEFSKNSHVIIQGTVGKELFILLSGKLEILKRNGVHVEEHLGEIHPTSIFGEIAVLEDIPRMADVIAQENSIVLSIPASTLRIAANDSPYSRELEIFRDAITVNQFFNSAPFFRDLSPRVIQMFISKGRYESYDKDTYVFKQGDHGESFYLLLRGHVSVQVNGMPIARISQGGFFGEISLIASVPRTGSVMALTKLDVLEIRRDSFWEILSQDLQIALFIESIGELRIIQDIEALKGPNSKIA